MSGQRPLVAAERPDREGELWARNEQIRLAELRADAKRPMGELLEAGIALSRIAGELAGTRLRKHYPVLVWRSRSKGSSAS